MVNNANDATNITLEKVSNGKDAVDVGNNFKPYYLKIIKWSGLLKSHSIFYSLNKYLL